MPIKAKEVSLNLPFGIGGVKFVANETEQRAAWSLYFELVTRISARGFDKENGRLRAALNSLHSLFSLTRSTLREAGPEVAHGPQSLGPVAIAILNQGLAPYLSRWHNLLEAHEQLRPEDVNSFNHEHSWEYFDNAVAELEVLQSDLYAYIRALGEIAGVLEKD